MKRLSSSERPLKVTCKNILLRLARLHRRDWNPYFSICIRNIYGHNITSDDASHTITYKILYLWGNMAIYGPRERPKIFKKGTFNKIFIRIGVGFMNYTGLENWVCNYTYITAVITDQGLSNVMELRSRQEVAPFVPTLSSNAKTFKNHHGSGAQTHGIHSFGC